MPCARPAHDGARPRADALDFGYALLGERYRARWFSEVEGNSVQISRKLFELAGLSLHHASG